MKRKSGSARNASIPSQCKFEKRITVIKEASTLVDDICERCGKCCLIKVQFGNLYVALDRHCSQYRVDNGFGTCLVYGKHTGSLIQNNIICLSVSQMIEAGLAPESCPYAKRIPGYKSLVINYEGKEKLNDYPENLF